MLPKKRFDYIESEGMRYEAEPLDLTVREIRNESINDRVNNVFRHLDPIPCCQNPLWKFSIFPPQPVYLPDGKLANKFGLREICKRPMNAFMIFSKKHRSVVLERNPGLGNREISKILSDCWYSLRPEERKHYIEFSLELKTAYHVHSRSVIKQNRVYGEEITSSEMTYLLSSPAFKDRKRISILEMTEFKEKFSNLPVFDVKSGKFDKSPRLVGTVFFPPDFISGDIDFESDESAKTPDTPECRKTIHEQRGQLILGLFQQQGFFPSDESVAEFQMRYAHVFPKRTGLQAKIRVMRQKLMSSKISPTA